MMATAVSSSVIGRMCSSNENMSELKVSMKTHASIQPKTSPGTRPMSVSSRFCTVTIEPMDRRDSPSVRSTASSPCRSEMLAVMVL